MIKSTREHHRKFVEYVIEMNEFKEKFDIKEKIDSIFFDPYSKVDDSIRVNCSVELNE